MAYEEKGLWLQLGATLVILFIYGQTLIGYSPDELASAGVISSLLMKIVIFSISIMVIGHIALAIVDHRNAEGPKDEREQLIELKGAYHGYWVLQVGVYLAVTHYLVEISDWSFSLHFDIPFMTLHILCSAFLLAEAVAYGKQLWHHRAGI